MRSLAQPSVLLGAAVAGAVTALACLPRLEHWGQRTDSVWFLVTLVGWATFVMWAAVLAWQEKHSGVRVFPRNVPAQMWLAALGLGVIGAVLSYCYGDPALRKLAPTDFPKNSSEWIEHILFNLGLEQPFLCFAPFAFFVRLVPSLTVAALGVVGFGLLVFALKMDHLGAKLPWEMLLGMALFRAGHSAITVWLYVRGGAWLVWTFALVLQSRHWLTFAQ